jgi:transmembrane sensor
MAVTERVDPGYTAIQEQAEHWLVRLRSGQATPEDAQAFKAWCAERPEHARAAHELNRIWSTLNAAGARVANDRRSTATIKPPRGLRAPGLRPGRRAFIGGAVMAGAAWLAWRPPLQLWPGLGDLEADYRTGTGEQRQVALSDRVTVDMNTQTRIDVRDTGGAANGIELLAGEAEVLAKGAATSTQSTLAARPFVVRAGAGRLQAVAARFNVRRTGSEVCVTCVDGSVELDHPSQRMTLSAAQQIVYDDLEVRPMSRVDTANVTAWRRGLLVFNDVPLADVVDEINRYRPGRIILHNTALGRRRVQAQFSIHQLDAATVLIRDLYGAHVTELPGGIALLS